MKKYGQGFAILSIQFSGFMYAEPLWIWYVFGFTIIATITIAYLIFVRVKRLSPFYIQCHSCSFRGFCDFRLKGSLLIELFLLIFFLPGILYGLWRCMGREPVCPSCGSRDLWRIV